MGHPPLIDDVAQIIQTTGLLWASLLQPFFTRLAAFPRAGGKAKDFNLYIAPLKRAGQNICANRSNEMGRPRMDPNYPTTRLQPCRGIPCPAPF